MIVKLDDNEKDVEHWHWHQRVFQMLYITKVAITMMSGPVFQHDDTRWQKNTELFKKAMILKTKLDMFFT